MKNSVPVAPLTKKIAESDLLFYQHPQWDHILGHSLHIPVYPNMWVCSRLAMAQSKCWNPSHLK